MGEPEMEKIRTLLGTRGAMLTALLKRARAPYLAAGAVLLLGLSGVAVSAEPGRRGQLPLHQLRDLCASHPVRHPGGRPPSGPVRRPRPHAANGCRSEAHQEFP